MRHIFFRGFLGLVWLAAAIVSGISGSFEMAVLYVILGTAFLYSAYAVWKKGKNDKRGQVK